MSKLGMLTAGAVGYVLGARAGRERYDQIATMAQRVWTNPRVQQSVSDAQDLAREKAPVVGEKVVETARHAGEAAVSKLKSDDDSDGTDSSGGRRVAS
jgi:SLT domain-containing protein